MGHRYTNPNPEHRPHDARAIFRWMVGDRLAGRRRIEPPGSPAPRIAPDLTEVRHPSAASQLTWIGHASFLGSLSGAAFLIDPVFSERIGRFYRRHVAPGLLPHQLPSLRALLVTHSHYDHLDRASIRSLPREVPVCVPLGLGRWFERHGFGQIHELGWWDSITVDPLRVTCVPARHWSRRGIGDTNRTLWGGFVVEAGGSSVYHAGDTAWFDGFPEIRRRFPELSAALLPIGAYSPAWFMEHHHLNPEQAGYAFLELGAVRMVPMHWGTFKLTDEPLVEPMERLRRWWSTEVPGNGRRLDELAIGQTMTWSR